MGPAMHSGENGPHLRVALAQFKPAKARVRENAGRIGGLVAEHGSDVDLLVFPETALSGYFLEGGVAETAVTADGLVELLGRPPHDAPDVVIGFYERWRRRLYNSAAYLTPAGDAWALVHVHRKMFLPTYGVFDEARFVEPGSEVRAFETRFGRFGILICEEAWHSLPATILALDGAELLLIVSASPARDFAPSGAGRPANLDRWDHLAPAIALEHGIFVVVAQLTGSEG
jgi:predicted amidohydrolase